MKITVTSLSSQKKAKELAKEAIKRKVAACAHYFQINSVYFWDGKVHEGKEWVLQLKSKNSRKAEKFLEENHEYSCPMIYTLSPSSANKKYEKYLGGFCDGK